MSQRAHGEHAAARTHKLAGVAALVALVVAVVAVIVVARRSRVIDEDPRAGSQAAATVDAAIDGDPLTATITPLGATAFRVPPTTVDVWLAEPARIVRGVTGARRVRDPDGFQLDDVRPGSPAAALGLRAGDVIRGINGTELNDLAAIAPLIAHSVDQITVDLRRGGRTLIFNYQIGR
jgi:membrane-associated protease RseP (regulator of RpoE activity)